MRDTNTARGATVRPTGVTVGELLDVLRTDADASLTFARTAPVRDGAARAALEQAALETVVLDASHDSREIRPGWLYCCFAGERTHGSLHAPAAVAAGSTALLTEEIVEGVDAAVPQIVVANSRRAAAIVAATLQHNPSRSVGVIGVTGTNGKTTTAAMLASILRAGGAPTAELGTLHGERTTPEATHLQRFLATERDKGTRYVVMEVSSHALAQHRVDGTDFALSVFTNMGRDHLDFHVTEDEYFLAKSRLFTAGLSRVAVINVDDPRGAEIAAICDGRVVEVRPSAAVLEQADLGGTRFGWAGLRIEISLAGDFNVANAVLAAAAARELGATDADIVAGLRACRAVRGRFSVLRGSRGVTGVVDYAHTPEGLAEVLRAARRLTPGRLTVVFGCGGDRDRGKRPEMGSVAARAADSVLITSDNPRHEDPAGIAAEIAAGVPRDSRGRVSVELDRREAIIRAFNAAENGDTIVVAGKGHEKTQQIGDVFLPFDDISAVSEVLGLTPEAGR